jgi:two-component system chemotaxis sensor kinase CheA
MDVVKKNIQKLKGVIEIDSVVGQGTKIQIKLPITLAIVPSLFVEVNGESFAVPLVNVIESIRIDPAEIQYMGSSQFVRLREQVIPLVRFADVLGMNTVSGDFWYREATKTPTLARRRDRLVFVVVGVGPERIGLVVDKLIGQQEIVIKPLGRLLSNQSGVAGGCLLGDGRVALVLDILEVFNKESAQRYLHDRRSS